MDEPAILKKKVFVMEDDSAIAGIVHMVLVKGGYTACIVPSSQKLRDELARGDPGLILLDILLLDENGLDILHGLKTNTATANIPVVIMSAGTNAEAEALAAGADGFLAKPFEIGDLLAVVKKFKID